MLGYHWQQLVKWSIVAHTVRLVLVDIGADGFEKFDGSHQDSDILGVSWRQVEMGDGHLANPVVVSYVDLEKSQQVIERNLVLQLRLKCVIIGTNLEMYNLHLLAYECDGEDVSVKCFIYGASSAVIESEPMSQFSHSVPLKSLFEKCHSWYR